MFRACKNGDQTLNQFELQMEKKKIADNLADSLERHSRGKLAVWISLFDLFFAPLGWVFLLLKFRDKKKIVEIKSAQYDGSYAVAGRTIFMKFLLFFLGLIVLAVTYALVTGNLEER